MKKVTVNLNEMKKLNSFVNVVSTFESDVDAIRDRYVINAKSIMGLVTLDLSKPLEITIYSEDEVEIQRFEEAMKNFQ